MSAIPANFTDGSITLSDDNSNSATLALANGDAQLSGLVPDGREAEVYQSRGATSGVRKGQRVYPTFTVSAQVEGDNQAFHDLAQGVTAGFTSTLADLGDYPGCDLDFSFDYGAESRDLVADDVILTGWEFQEGSPNTVSMTFQIVGPLTYNGTTYVSAR
jgi:hypothetical protein